MLCVERESMSEISVLEERGKRRSEYGTLKGERKRRRVK